MVPWWNDGQRLFAALFADSTLREAWAEARSLAPRRRIRLRIDPDASELHALPWELLLGDGVMLAAGAETPFSRYLPVTKPWGGTVKERPIRMLVAISSLDDLQDCYKLTPIDAIAERLEVYRHWLKW